MNRRILGAALSGAAILVIATSSVASAHVVKQFGSYSIALGWLTEPTFVGEPNAVVAIVTDDKGKPVNDLASGDLTVFVSAGGQTSATLPLDPSYDPDTGFGTQGLYFTDVIPTQPGDYTFHLSGKVHDTAVDETATSSDTTFNSVEDPSSVQFPAKVPTTTEISTKVDQLGTRIQAAADAAASASTSVGAAADAANAATAAAKSATDAATAAQTTATAAQTAAANAASQASQAQTVGIVVGGIGILVGLVGVLLALRARKAA
jgi:hypothetical protein